MMPNILFFLVDLDSEDDDEIEPSEVRTAVLITLCHQSV